MLKTKKKRKGKTLPAGQTIALGFAGIILLGALLLMLPAAARSGESAGFLTALFTATSSTCVTGLVMGDTWQLWSGFGQTVIICLIQIGGLGFMTVITFFISLLRKKTGMKSSLVLADSIGVGDMDTLKDIFRHALFGGLIIEGCGALILFVRFLFRYDFLTSLKLGVFHAISGFCNAGFDIFGFETPGASLIPFYDDPVVLLTLSLLIQLGGLGFIVWYELLETRPLTRFLQPKIFQKKNLRHRLSVYTKAVLIVSAALTVGGWVYFCVTEWNNPGTLGPMTVPEKLLGGLFQSVTVRTAGFAGIDQGAMTEAGKAGSVFFMLIGGSSGSTAGGLKTVTFLVLVLFLWSKLRGKPRVSFLHRTIPDKQVLDAVTLAGVLVGLAFVGALVICGTADVTFTDAVYETVSALATVGLTTGITPTLPMFAKCVLIVFMFFGRVGILTLCFGFLQQRPETQEYKYAETQFLIG